MRQSRRTSHFELPNLLELIFLSSSAYMEVIIRHITVSPPIVLRSLPQPTRVIPCLPPFINTAENFRFNRATFEFYDERVFVVVYPDEEAKTYSFGIAVNCWHLDWQVSSAAQIFTALSQKFSTVEHLTIEHEVNSRSSEKHNEFDRTE